MITRRHALGSVALLLDWAASAVAGQPPTQSTLTEVFKHDLPNLTTDGWEVNVNWVDYPPGRVGARHRHPGFTLAYVLEGAVVTKITGQPERTYTVGQMFYEPPESIHEVSRNASQTDRARLLAMNFMPKGQQLTMPA
jgi:quercetin dioxygenase-like cupin family protein